MIGVLDRDIRKNVRVSADQLVDDGAANVVDGEAAGLVGDLGVEDDLQEDVSQFRAQGLVIPCIDGLEGLVGLFEQVAFQRRMGLLTIPRTAAISAQACHDIDQLLEAPISRHYPSPSPSGGESSVYFRFLPRALSTG